MRTTLPVLTCLFALAACSSGVGWLPEGTGSPADPTPPEGGAGGQAGSIDTTPGTPGSGTGSSPGHTTTGSGAQGGTGGTSTGSGSASGSTGSGSASGSTGSGSGSTGTGMPSEQCKGTLPQTPGCYWEPVCPDAPLEDLKSSYTSSKWLTTALEATTRRYPSANCLFDMYSSDVGNYAEKQSFGSLCESMMTMAHEETHGYDYEHALGNSHFSYYIRCDLALQTPWLDGFPRSEILPYVEGSATDLYDGTYLTGTQGTYGFVELLDEWNAYINGMAALALVGDHVPAFGISGTDGALAFAYYVELYLKVARTKHPTLYNTIKSTPAFLDLLRLQWNRMHFFLTLADAYPKLSIEAENIKPLLYSPESQQELDLLLGPLTPTPCN
ncbi:MAG: hypothetical protein R3B70_13730 [Polyangiaceae bacterium]